MTSPSGEKCHVFGSTGGLRHENDAQYGSIVDSMEAMKRERKQEGKTGRAHYYDKVTRGFNTVLSSPCVPNVIQHIFRDINGKHMDRI